MSKTEAVSIAELYCKTIAKSMDQSYFYKQMGIKGLEEFDPNSSNAQEWARYIMEVQKSVDVMQHNNPNDKPITGIQLSIPQKEKTTIDIAFGPGSNNSIPIFNMKSAIYTRITIGDKVLDIGVDHSNRDKLPKPGAPAGATKKKDGWIIEKLLDYYSHTEVSYPLKDSKGIVIGSVLTGINSEFILFVVIALLIGIVISGIVALIIANIINKILTAPITNPLIQLDEKIMAIANEDFQNQTDKQIVLKRPLREIESIADSTNRIMNKMKEYSRLLEDQKKVLENQNDELEAQNEELIESKRQIEETQSMLVQSENMASIGQLTAAITHEINTPLGAINSNVQICDMFINMLSENDVIKSNEELSEQIDQMKETNSISVMACQRVGEIIKSLKTFSRLDQAEFQETDIHEGIRSVLILTSNLWKKKITIHEDYENSRMVKCFPGLLNQVIMNIMVNAIQSIEEKGDIFIKTYADENQAYISIRDTGCGIKGEDIPKIFDSGFSTKGAGIGMGLGLSICQNIIQKHEGEIRVISELGKGTEFIVCIPINNDKT
ncbi:MAG: ATP-binding protein [Clostridia bacterium]|nr:ATP-binding protein [Clostridia bacterium]